MGDMSSPGLLGDHRDTLDTVLREFTGQRSLRQLFGATSDEFWRWCFTQGYRREERLRTLLPTLPPESVQLRFSGVAGDDAMNDAYGFYVLVRSLFRQHSTAPMDSVLEFGCGWGRLVRWFLRDIEADRLWGIDCMPEAIEICRATNHMNRFELVDPLPPSNVPSETFDLVYSYSVFSHLSEDAHLAWLTELERVLKPGGLLVATTRPREFIMMCADARASRDDRDWLKGMQRAFPDEEDALSRFDRGEFLYDGVGGGGVLDRSFYGETCIPRQYVIENWSKRYEYIGYVDDRRLCVQNVIIVRRRA